MKKIFVCILAALCMVVTCAYAADEGDDIEIPENTEAADELGEVSVTPAPSPADESGDTGDPDSSGGDPDENDAADVTPEPEETPRATMTLQAEVYAEETPEVSPTPDPEAMTYEEELLTTMGNIEGILVFFAVILLGFLAYKFLRMFF